MRVVKMVTVYLLFNQVTSIGLITSKSIVTFSGLMGQRMVISIKLLPIGMAVLYILNPVKRSRKFL